MRIIYGTGNPAKLDSMRDRLSGLPITIVGLNELETKPEEPEEMGSDPLDNAIAKARAYYRALGEPVFSCDSGLFIEGLPPEAQPGTHVRNIGGIRLDDEGMVKHYAGIARSMGGRCFARYCNAICLVLGDGDIYARMSDDLHGNRFILTDTPHERRTPGFPLDSLSIHIGTGKYYNDLDEQHAFSNMEGFLRFFKEVLRGVKS